jgi:hypothetical protein
MSPFSIARLVPGSTAANTINIPTVEIFLQKSPNKPAGDQRGIVIDFEVEKDGAIIQAGTTGPNGRVLMRVPGGSALLRIRAAGQTAEYAVSLRNAAIEGAATDAGQQRRLRMLGYHIGHSGPEGNGVDGAAVPSREMDRSIMEFQADTAAINAAGNADAISGVANGATQGQLTTAAGA